MGFQVCVEPDSGGYQQAWGSHVFGHFCLPGWVFHCWIVHSYRYSHVPRPCFSITKIIVKTLLLLALIPVRKD